MGNYASIARKSLQEKCGFSGAPLQCLVVRPWGFGMFQESKGRSTALGTQGAGEGNIIAVLQFSSCCRVR